MKRLIMSVVSALMLVSLAAPAQAGHGPDWYPNSHNGADRWSQTAGNETFCVTGFGPLSSGEFENAMGTLLTVGYDNWADSTDIETRMELQGYPGGEVCANSYSFNTIAYNSGSWNGCDYLENNLPNITSRVTYQNAPDGNPSAVASTISCDLNDNGYYDFFWVNFIPEDTGLDWHFNYFTNVPQGDYDFGGVFYHELGHAYGFKSGASNPAHFVDTSDACDVNETDYSLMCDSAGIGAYNNGTRNGRWWRGETFHDRGAANDEYP